MVPFDKDKIFLYAYRHSYAQRHADAGVPVDVLKSSCLTGSCPPPRATTGSAKYAAERPSTVSRLCSSTATATASGARPRHCSTPSGPAGPSARSPSPTESAPNTPTSPRAARTARSASAASAAGTSAPTPPTSPTSRHTSAISCGTVNASLRPSMPTTGRRPKRCRPTKRTPASADSSAGSRPTSTIYCQRSGHQLDEAIALVRRGRRPIHLGIPQVRQPHPDFQSGLSS